MSTVLRLIQPGDAEEITALWHANRDFLAPWEPTRPDTFFTVKHQREAIERDLAEYQSGRLTPFVICAATGEIAGKISLNGITRGALQSASLGYWVRQDMNGLGLASTAVREAVDHAFGTMKLHRLQAETLLHNVASQRVLAKTGFRPYGVAPAYLKIAGRWQDHLLFHLLSSVGNDREVTH